jgi:hypothetical protein
VVVGAVGGVVGASTVVGTVTVVGTSVVVVTSGTVTVVGTSVVVVTSGSVTVVGTSTGKVVVVNVGRVIVGRVEAVGGVVGSVPTAGGGVGPVLEDGPLEGSHEAHAVIVTGGHPERSHTTVVVVVGSNRLVPSSLGVTGTPALVSA